MKFSFVSSFVCSLAFVASAACQSIVILEPQDGANLSAGQNFTTELGFPDQLTGLTHIAITISLLNCAGSTCAFPASEYLGNVLLIDKNYNPQFHDGSKPPYTDYSVAFPSGLSKGLNTLAVSHYMLLGASSIPVLEFKNVTINVV